MYDPKQWPRKVCTAYFCCLELCKFLGRKDVWNWDKKLSAFKPVCEMYENTNSKSCSVAAKTALSENRVWGYVHLSCLMINSGVFLANVNNIFIKLLNKPISWNKSVELWIYCESNCIWQLTVRKTAVTAVNSVNIVSNLVSVLVINS